MNAFGAGGAEHHEARFAGWKASEPCKVKLFPGNRRWPLQKEESGNETLETERGGNM